MAIFSKLKQIKDMRQQAKGIQSTLSQEHVETSAAWGKVKVAMSGNQEVEKVTIDPELLKPEKKSELEGAVKEAVSDAIKKVQKIMAAKIREHGGLEKMGLK
ncbi:MAG: YbaB/EbfC family nucleoid-associated protein [Patescibacteria group bacterium]